MLAVSMPNLRTSASLVETATKCLATAASLLSASTIHLRAVAALVIVSSVVKVFDDRMNSVSAALRSWVASANAAPSTLATNRKFIERSVKVRCADTNVNHVPDALAGMTLPLAAARAIGKRLHLLQHGVNFRDHVPTIDFDLHAFGRAQRRMEDRALFGDVDFLAPK